MRKIIPLAAVLLLALILWLFMDKSVLVIKDVRVEGAQSGEETDIIRLSGVQMGQSIRKVDVEKLALNVESTGKYACTGIAKDYPSGIIISVEYRQAAAVVEVGGFMVTLDAEGYVMSVDASVSAPELIYVTGLEPTRWDLGRQVLTDAAKLSAFKTMINSINANGARQYISEINVADRKNLYAYSRTGIYVMFGDEERMDDKLVWMMHALADLESRGETSGRLDVSSGDKADYSAADL